MATKKTTAPEALQIEPLKQGQTTVRIVGNTPLFFNSMPLKAQGTLFLGGGKKTAAQKKEIKHDPYAEFRASVYRIDAEDSPTLLGFPAAGVKGAMATAALETQGLTKTSVQRLVFLPQELINVYGVPQIRCDVVRSADMNKTPDVRTRAFLPEWCAEVDVRFVEPTLTGFGIISLLVNAGLTVGIGDFRQEKGKGSFGAFRPVAHDDSEWARIAKQGGRMAQIEAMDNPSPANLITSDLLNMFDDEVARRSATTLTAAE